MNSDKHNGTSKKVPVERRRRTSRPPSCSWLPPTSPVISPRFSDFASLQLLLLANTQGRTCHRLAPRGELSVAVEEVLAGLQALGYRVLRDSDTSVPLRRGGYPPDYEARFEATFLLVHPYGCVEVDAFDERPLRVLSVDEHQTALLRERIAEWVRPSIDRSAGVLYMLKSDCDEFHFSAIGTGGRPLRRENYAPSVLDAIDHLAFDIEAADPCGRIALLTGPPGTGKTHVIRGVLASAKRPCFVVLQAGDLVSFLDASPLSALTDFARREAKDRPIVLVVEDADGCLVPRGADNMSLISALLNLSDGLIGATFDIRILATTNARKVEIDPAILRPGRLCRRIDVLPLEPDHATQVLGGLLGTAPRSAFRTASTLAEVYAAAREQGAG